MHRTSYPQIPRILYNTLIQHTSSTGRCKVQRTTTCKQQPKACFIGLVGSHYSIYTYAKNKITLSVVEYSNVMVYLLCVLRRSDLVVILCTLTGQRNAYEVLLPHALLISRTGGNHLFSLPARKLSTPYLQYGNELLSLL